MKRILSILWLTAGTLLAYAASPGSPQLYGYVTQSDDTSFKKGVYTFTAEADAAPLLLSSTVLASNGGTLIGDTYYTLNATENIWGGSDNINLYGWSTDDWSRKTNVKASYKAKATDICYDETDGVIYGCFFNSDDTFMFGTVDLVYGNRKDIASVQRWNAIAADNDGTIYAINMQGNLLKIFDKATGETSVMGRTGVTPDGLGSACVDPRTGTLYWAVRTSDGEGKLFTVDKSNGTATEICRFPGNERFTGIFIPKPEAVDKAPAAATDLDAIFPNGALSGKLVFKAPTTTFGGETASGTLNYTVTVDGTEKASGTTEYGTTVEEPLTVEKSALYEFAVKFSNTAGTGPTAKLKKYIGFDTPVAPQPSAVYSDGKIIVSWAAVDQGKNGGFVDPAKVRYNITRMPGYVDVATNFEGTVFEDPIEWTSEIKKYYYQVQAVIDGLKSSATNTGDVIVGNIVPPYTQTFENVKALDGFTSINLAGTNKWNITNKQAYIETDPGSALDAWLLSPAVKLEGGKAYEISIDARHYTGSPAKLEVRFGNAAEVAAMTGTVMTSFDLNSTSPAPTYKGMLNCPADGIYHIGIHATGTTDAFQVWVDNLGIAAGVGLSAPAAVSDFTVTADASGAHIAEISFKTPDVDDAGAPLTTGLTKVELYRGETLIKTFDSPATASVLNHTDNEATAGETVYTAVAYNSAGKGRPAEAKAFIGFNKPLAPTKVEIAEADGKVTLTWDAVTADTDGKALSTDNVNYAVLTTDKDGNAIIVKDKITSTTYSYQAVGNDEEQRYMYFAIVATTEGGVSANALSPYIPVGKPYSTPYRESFEGAHGKHIHGITRITPDAGWQVFDDSRMAGIGSYDSDGGYLAFIGSAVNDAAEIATGKISLRGLSTPVLTFEAFNYMLNEETSDDNTVEVLVDSGNGFKPLGTTTLSKLANAGWNRVSVPLTEFAGKSVIVKFRAAVVTYQQTHLDNIRIDDDRQANLCINSISAPTHVRTGEIHTVSVGVENTGRTDATAINVALMRGGRAIAEKTISALAAGEFAKLTFNAEIPAGEAPQTSYVAELTWNGDTHAADNTLEADATTVLVPQYAPVTNLQGVENTQGNALSWTAPAADGHAPAEIADGFEDFTSYTMQGERGWTFVDADGLKVSGIQGFDFPNSPAPNPGTMAWFVMDSSFDQIAANRLYTATEGKKYLSNMCIYDNGTVDDWAISPELFGGKQTISFIARSFSSEFPETLEILYSTGSTDTDDFTNLTSISKLPSAWTKYLIELPEGARRLALRAVSTNGFMLHIDKVCFIPAGEPEKLSIKGYNIYRDGKIIATSTAPAYTDTEGGQHSYTVSAVYDKGEGPVCEAVTVGTSGICAPAEISGIFFTVSPDAVTIHGADGMEFNIFTADGRLEASGTAKSDAYTIALPKGLHIARCGASSAKLIVR